MTTSASSSSADPPPRIPARLSAVENAWESVAFWATATRMRAVPPKAVAAALLPAAVVAVLFFFDHGISALMARDVLRDRGAGYGEKGEAAATAETAEAGAAAGEEEGEEEEEEEEEEEVALEAGGLAAKAAAATTAGAASPGKASTTTKLKPSAYAYDLFLCVSFCFLWHVSKEKREREEKERSSREKSGPKNRTPKKDGKKSISLSLLIIFPTGYLHDRRGNHGPAADSRHRAPVPDAYARAVGAL